MKGLKGFLWLILSASFKDASCGGIQGGRNISMNYRTLVYLFFFTVFTPTSDNLVETVPAMGKQFKITLQIKVSTAPSSVVEAFRVGNELVALKAMGNGVFRVKYDLNGISGFIDNNTPFNLNEWYPFEIKQSLILGKVLSILCINVTISFTFLVLV